MLCLSLWCSGAGQVLADNVLSLRSVEKLSICDINPVPLLHVLSQNAEHCSVSTLRIALEYNSEQVRCVSMGPCCTLPTQYPSSHTCTPCVQSYCIICHTAEGVRITAVLCGQDTVMSCILVTANCTCLLS